MTPPAVPKMSERELSQSIVDAAKTLGWRVYRTWNSIHSPRGFPDLCMVRGRRLIFAELKTDIGKVKPEQQAWLDELRTTEAAEVYVWRPADLSDAYRVLMS